MLKGTWVHPWTHRGSLQHFHPRTPEFLCHQEQRSFGSSAIESWKNQRRQMHLRLRHHGEEQENRRVCEVNAFALDAPPGVPLLVLPRSLLAFRASFRSHADLLVYNHGNAKLAHTRSLQNAPKMERKKTANPDEHLTQPTSCFSVFLNQNLII
jgi:hypothetical protein